MASNWDIVRVNFPHANSDAAGARPALIVASPRATDAFDIVWVLMITSARHAAWPDDVAITDLTAAGLSQPSIVRTGKIAAIDSRLVTTIGNLCEPNREAVRERLRQHIGPALTL